MQILKPLLAVLAALLPQLASAGAAKLFIHPTLIELDDRQRSATLSVVNRGDAVGTFAIDWIDYAMTEEGGLTVADGDAAWSLQPHIRYSPRRVTLRPGETQTVKLALRRRDGVLEGEYYSHLKVLVLNDDVAASSGAAEDPAAGESLIIDARSAIAVPVVWRNTSAEPRAVIDAVVIDREEQALHVRISRVGDLSTRGFLHVVRIGGDGARTPLTQPLPLVIYPSVEQRTATVPLASAAVEGQGSVEVIYSSNAETNDAAAAFASYTLAP